MDEQDLELLLMLNKYKNITKTAEKLHVTQPALTRRIKALEESLGINLLIRSRNGIIFTPLAESILPQITELSEQFQNMRAYLNSNSGYVGGTVKIGMSINYAQYRLAKVLKEFLSLYPQVNVTIKTTQSQSIYKMFLNKEVSLAILRGEFKWDEGCRLFNKEPVCVVAMEDFEISNLNHMNYLRRNSENAFEAGIQRWFHENNLHPKNNIYIDNITTTLQLVKEGLGWAILPQVCLDDFEGVKKPIAYQDGSMFVRNSYLLYRRQYLELPQVALFAEKILSYGNVREG